LNDGKIVKFELSVWELWSVKMSKFAKKTKLYFDWHKYSNQNSTGAVEISLKKFPIFEYIFWQILSQIWLSDKKLLHFSCKKSPKK